MILYITGHVLTAGRLLGSTTNGRYLSVCHYGRHYGRPPARDFRSYSGASLRTTAGSRCRARYRYACRSTARSRRNCRNLTAD
jgi:hypothetical protein